MAASWPAFLGLTISLLLLAWLSRQVSLHVQGVVYLLTGSPDMATVLLFLVFLPGVFVHETAHWGMARLMGLKTSKFRVWPERRRNRIGLGSVHVSSGGVWIDSVVGLAPMMVASMIIALVGHGIFNTSRLTATWQAGDLGSVVGALVGALGTKDGVLWAYFLFAVANAMMPSASDREPVKPVLLYIAIAAGIYLVLGLPSDWLVTGLHRATEPIQILTGGLVFVILLDIVVLAVLYLLELLLSVWRHVA